MVFIRQTFNKRRGRVILIIKFRSYNAKSLGGQVAKKKATSWDSTVWTARRTVKALVLLGVVMLGTSGYLWWHNVRSNPQRVFWAAIDNSLSSSSVTRRVGQEANGQGQIQFLQLQASPRNVVTGNSRVFQGASAQTSITNINTDLIGLPSADYARYSNLASSKPGANFSGVENVWGKAQSQDGLTSGQIYNQTVLGMVPIANLSLADRRTIVDNFKANHVYQVDYSKVKRSRSGGRPVYEFNVTIDPKPYVAELKDFAMRTGLTHLAKINPNDYTTTAKVVFAMKVDVWSQEIVSITNQSSGQELQFSGYDSLDKVVKAPQTNTTLQDLQTKLQAIQ